MREQVPADVTGEDQEIPRGVGPESVRPGSVVGTSLKMEVRRDLDSHEAYLKGRALRRLYVSRANAPGASSHHWS